MDDPKPKTFKQWVKTTHWDVVIFAILLYAAMGGFISLLKSCL